MILTRNIIHKQNISYSYDSLVNNINIYKITSLQFPLKEFRRILEQKETTVKKLVITKKVKRMRKKDIPFFGKGSL